MSAVPHWCYAETRFVYGLTIRMLLDAIHRCYTETRFVCFDVMLKYTTMSFWGEQIIAFPILAASILAVGMGIC